MGKIVYITEVEHEKWKKVAAAFTELYELEDIVVLDAGIYGFDSVVNGHMGSDRAPS
jgi:hypothetical protein